MQVLALDEEVPVSAACDVLDVSRATLYRHRRPPPKTVRQPRRNPRRLSDEERQRVVDTLNSPEFVDQPPLEVYGKLLSMGIFLTSVRSMYRILAERREVRERRRGHVARRHAVPRLSATAPNQVWTWDITKVPGVERGVFFYVFVIIDLFSRYAVGWLAATTENAALATHFISETAARHGVEPGQLVVHSDRGSPMTANAMTQLLATLQIERSLSRPRVSNDNPFVESSFKTAKYQPDYPGLFASLSHVRAWFGELFDWYCNHHQHSGIALFTPADVFHGRVAEVAAVRQRALDAAYAANPQRFVHGPPRAALPPAIVHINPIPPDALQSPAGPTGGHHSEVLAPKAATLQRVADGSSKADAVVVTKPPPRLAPTATAEAREIVLSQKPAPSLRRVPKAGAVAVAEPSPRLAPTATAEARGIVLSQKPAPSLRRVPKAGAVAVAETPPKLAPTATTEARDTFLSQKPAPSLRRPPKGGAVAVAEPSPQLAPTAAAEARDTFLSHKPTPSRRSRITGARVPNPS